ncbi:TonB-dependent receptor [Novosphingopyxis sp.]|uniref:TonB-dependent receptor n=1 Tax=Novosphingopyxis sp. TaxID=2709690 RepID=UPI003B5A1CF3
MKRFSLRPTPRGGALLAGTLAVGLAPQMALASDAAAPMQDRDIVVIGERPDDANPNADPDAAYKIDRSSDGKYTEPVRDTPKSQTIIPKEVIEDIGATSFREVVRSTPGVTLGTGEGGNAFGDRIFIRGFDARNDVYIDGLRDPGVTSREIFAVEQIEIVKGPSGTFGGRGTTGGTVSLQSKQPLPGNFVIGEGSVGTDNRYRATLDANQKLSDTLSLRVNGLYDRGDTPGRDFVKGERYGGAAAIAWDATPELSLSADYYYFRSDSLPDYGIPYDVANNRPFDVPRGNFYGVLDRDFQTIEADVATVHIAYQPLDSLRFSSRTRYGKTANRYIVSAPERPDTTDPDPAEWTVLANPKNRNSDNEYFANVTDARFDFATAGIGHTLLTGVEYAHEQVRNNPYNFDSEVVGGVITPPITIVQNLPNPDPTIAFPFPILESGNITTTTVESLSAFAIDTVKFGEHFQALLGVRYDGFDIVAAGGADRATGAPLPDRRSDVDFLNYQASLVYKPVEPVTLYASFSTSSNPSGDQLDGSGASYDGLDQANAALQPERNKSYEIGLKAEPFGPDLLFTAALFRIDKTNARQQLGRGGPVVNIGELRSQGGEIGISGKLTPRLQLFGGYTYLDAVITKAADPEQQGARFANVPRHSASLLATYQLTDAFMLGGQATVRSEIFGGTQAAGDTRVPGFVRFDAVARYDIGNALQVRLNVLNLTDELYYDTLYRSGTPFVYVAPGRSALVSLTAGF